MAVCVNDTGYVVKFRFATGGTPDGTTVDAARVKLRRPNEANSVEWPCSIVSGETTAQVVTAAHMLVAGDVPRAGKYKVRAKLYIGGECVFVSDPGPFLPVDPEDVPWSD